MRLFAIVTITFFAILFGSIGSQDKAKATNPQSSTTSNPAQPPPSTTVEVNIGYPREAEDRQSAKQDAKKEKAPFMTNFEWAISIITAVYSLFSVLTFFSIKKQTDIAEISANAAKRSADALINSERSWVMVDVEWPTASSGRLLNLSSIAPDNSQRDQTQVYVNIVCVNRGKSPAWIVERIAKAEISGAFWGPNLSTVNDSEIDRRLISLGIAGTPEARTEDSIKLYAPGKPGNKYVLVYGVVKYRDAFTPKGQLRETWFGYYTLETRLKDPPARISQPDYNNYT
jgi:hypothetical protein